MAIKLPSFKVFSTSDAKSRVFLIFAVVVGFSLAIFFVGRYFTSGDNAIGASKVAAAPTGLQSVPGGQLSPAYYRAVVKANEQVAQQAQITGGTAVPTLINIPAQQSTVFQQPQQNCTVLCPNPDDPNIEKDLNDLVKSGKLSQKDADKLLALAKANASVDEYAAALDELVREGKLTPEQARALLEKYKKQHQNALLTDSAKTMDALIKSGQLPLDIATQLLTLQKSGITPAAYAEELNRLVAAGKISPAAAARLLAQYTQQQAAEATKNSIFKLHQLAKAGAITPQVADALAELQRKNVPVDEYEAMLQRLVAEGKITPAEAARLLAEYKAKRAVLGGTEGLLEALIKQQTIECEKDLKKLGQSNPKTLPPSCQKLNELRAMAAQLKKLQANNASPSAYADALKQAVHAGLLSPEAAANLMQYYQASTVPAGNVPSVQTALPTTEDFAKLQQTIQQAQPATTEVAATDQSQAQFAAAAAEARRAAEQERMQRIQQLETAMSAQAQTLVAAWAPPKMTHQEGTPVTKTTTTTTPTSALGSNGSALGGGKNAGTALQAPLIKTGTIMYAVLDTAVDSDYPDTPVMATVVQGPFKGARLLGKLVLPQGKDRVSLTFNLMDKSDWLKTKTVTAFAIDPDTARTAMASSVDHHYLMRYGSLFASSFLSGYASGVQNAGTSTTGIFGTSTQNPKLSFGNNIAVALGQVGTTFTDVVKGYVNTPATVKINSGVGLGILFMADVT